NGPFYYRAQTIKISKSEYLWKRAPESFCQDYAGFQNYTNRFLAIQYAIDISIIGYVTNKTNLFSKNVFFNHFGCPKAYDDQLNSIYESFVPIYFSMIFLITFMINIGYIVEERENKTKEYLRIYGLRTWINNFVWMCRSMLIYVILISIVIGLSVISIPSSQQRQTSIARAIFNSTHWTLIWTVLFIYSIEISAFSICFAQLFKRVLLAKLIGFIRWIITFIDFYRDVSSVGIRYFSCLFPNLGLLFSLQIILQYERKGTKLMTYKNLYSNLFSYQLYVGLCLLLMIIYSGFYLLLAIYIERIHPGEFGTAKEWNYFFKCSSKAKTNDEESNQNDNNTNHSSELYSMNKTKIPLIKISNLTKKYKNFVAVSDLSLNFYSGEVCSLLGPNGAGKTTITFLIVGMSQPTSGTITIDANARKLFGFCSQSDILYDELSAEEHLKLIGKMRSMNSIFLKESIEKILELINLNEDRDTLTKNLSGGMKRRLSIGMSLFGDPKILIFDEPTAGVQFEYRFFVEKKQNYENEIITKFIQRYIPDVILEKESPIEMIFGIKRNRSKQISRLISELDKRKLNIGIEEYGFSMITIEDVFLKLLREQGENSILSNEIEINHVFNNNYEYEKGFRLTIFRLLALLIKRWQILRRRYNFLLAFFIFPILFQILIVIFIPSAQDTQAAFAHNAHIKDAQVKFNPSSYNPHTVVIYSNDHETYIYKNLINSLEKSGANIDEIHTNDILDYIHDRYLIDEETFINKYQMAFSISFNETLIENPFSYNIYFSTVNFHVMPTSLNIMSSNLFQYYSNSTLKQIETINQPIIIPKESSKYIGDFFDILYCFDVLPLSLFNFIDSIIGIVFIGILILPITQERLNHSKNLQLLTNLSKKIYWLSNIIFDICLCLILSSILTIILKIGSIINSNPQAEIQIYRNIEQIGYYFLIIFMYSLASVPMVYVYSFIQKSEFVGFITFFIINILACFVDMTFHLISVVKQTEHLDEDVRNERELIINKNTVLDTSIIFVRDLVQGFKKRKEKSMHRQSCTIIDHLNFFVPKQSCFGLLGANGAGKTTLFRMLIGESKPISGDIFINGENINKIKDAIDIGYCPQFNWLINNLTVTETITLFARLKGIRWAELPELCNHMLQIFDLGLYENKQIQELSGGNKRKVSTLLAFMGKSMIVLLDEPTTSLDALAKRKLWNIIRTAHHFDRTVILTSHSMEECEALCTKIGIMKSGQLLCLGNLQKLKQRFGNGYIIQVQLSFDSTDRFLEELLFTFPRTEVQKRYNGTLFCTIPFLTTTEYPLKLSFIFRWFYKKKKEQLIRTFAIKGPTLEDIFIRSVGENRTTIDIGSNEIIYTYL
ncbi:unnamed protein product, partial [Adineta ricciae]